MIDPEIQAELRERFNPDGSLLRRHQLQMLEMLKYIDKICQEHNIPYWLSSGTCLGAVRHGGFIPWDDDVDIEMLGADYDRFLKVADSISDCPYAIQTHKNDPAFMYQFAKVRDKNSQLKENMIIDRDYKFRGIFIDIFPLDKSPYKYSAVIGEYLLRGCLATNKIESVLLRKTCRKICYFVSFGIIAPLVKFIVHFKNTDCLRHRFGSIFHKERYASDIFPLKRAGFEGYKFLVPNNVDAYLKQIFGDYMTIPQQKKSHIKSLCKP